jgi:diaminohydroxyphosphoribosylaminopyrimidine deaminase/5-amino-6-(5-phosphoribosylamino)uracil reductase
LSISEGHEKYMSRCLTLALKGLGNTAPNPMVGCVIVYENRIIGEGYHANFGGPHAEVIAIKSVSNHSLLGKSTLYVNLEPCTHYGKTPPCTRLIIEKKIPVVITGTLDPNPLVSGKGIQALKREGVNVITDILKEDCLHLNRRFFTFFLKKRPYIILKWAQTKDGFIDVDRKEDKPAAITWITNEACRRLVHKWRAEEQAILVGSGTIIRDNPKLTVRTWPGRNPLRLVIDREGKLSGDIHLLDSSSETVVFTNVPLSNKSGLKYILLDKEKSIIQSVLDFLHSINVQSVMVEGGKILIDEFLRQDSWDEARVFTGDKIFGMGVPAPEIRSQPLEVSDFAGNILRIYKNKESLQVVC